MRTQERSNGRRVGRVGAGATVLIVALVAGAWAPTAEGRSRRNVSLVWHVESPEGQPLDSRRADEPINPASIVKAATTLWALEQLGPRHRFETTVGTPGRVDPERETLDGDLVVLGGADPDFHVENAFLIAQALNRQGIRRVDGRLVIGGAFWIGWEGGSEGKLVDPIRRANRMALRLRDALDYRRWNRATRREWNHFASRRGIPQSPRPRIVIRDGVAIEDDPGPMRTLLIHRSNELVNILKRFNAYSNNDIERFGASLGSPEDLAAFLARRWETADPPPSFETLSGLGTNRMTPRDVVNLMRELRSTCDKLGLQLQDVLPVAGCDPGTMKLFPRLGSGAASKVLTGKTGTLTYTDDGITALAGYLRTKDGEVVFCVAAPRASGRISTARRREEDWVLERINQFGGPRSGSCGLTPWFSDADAKVIPGPPPPDVPQAASAGR